MVIINTSATDVSIHAVSPELGVHFSRTLPPQAGGPASCASAMSPNARQRIVVPKRAAATDTSLWRAYVPDSMVSLLDDKIFISLIERAFRIRTGETDKVTVQTFTDIS